MFNLITKHVNETKEATVYIEAIHDLFGEEYEDDHYPMHVTPMGTIRDNIEFDAMAFALKEHIRQRANLYLLNTDDCDAIVITIPFPPSGDDATLDQAKEHLELIRKEIMTAIGRA